jgi:hypothetical protein
MNATGLRFRSSGVRPLEAVAGVRGAAEPPHSVGEPQVLHHSQAYDSNASLAIAVDKS